MRQPIVDLPPVVAKQFAKAPFAWQGTQIVPAGATTESIQDWDEKSLDERAPETTRGGDVRINRRHCEERSDEAIQGVTFGSGLLRFARNDGFGAAMMAQD